MRITEISSPAEKQPKFNDVSELYETLKSKGFTKLGQGVDQTAWLNPTTGLVWKVFADLSQGGEVLLRFAEFCKAHPTNPMLPDFYSIRHGEFENGKPFCIAVTERLFPITDSGWRRVLARIGSYIGYKYESKSLDELYSDILKFVQSGDPNGTAASVEYAELLSHIGTPTNDISEPLKVFIITVAELARVGDQNGFGLDLHGNNFMLGSDGTIVINDPWVSGE